MNGLSVLVLLALAVLWCPLMRWERTGVWSWLGGDDRATETRGQWQHEWCTRCGGEIA